MLSIQRVFWNRNKCCLYRGCFGTEISAVYTEGVLGTAISALYTEGVLGTEISAVYTEGVLEQK